MAQNSDDQIIYAGYEANGVTGSFLRSTDQGDTWETNKPVSSGVYFYKLESGKYTSTKKMLLIK